MTENQMERRYDILGSLMYGKRWKYSIKLIGSFIDIKNNVTLEGIYTDDLQAAKRWIKKDMKEGE